MEWRLFSPSATALSCEIERAADGFVLRVIRDGAVLFTSGAPDPEPLRARAAAWRASLEASGYSASPAEAVRPGVRPSELRSALRGVIECAAVLEMHDGSAARELRNHATAGLAAVALRDMTTLAAAVASARATLGRIATPTPGSADLIGSCRALLDRIEAAPEYGARD